MKYTSATFGMFALCCHTAIAPTPAQASVTRAEAEYVLADAVKSVVPLSSPCQRHKSCQLHPLPFCAIKDLSNNPAMKFEPGSQQISFDIKEIKPEWLSKNFILVSLNDIYINKNTMSKIERTPKKCRSWIEFGKPRAISKLYKKSKLDIIFISIMKSCGSLCGISGFVSYERRNNKWVSRGFTPTAVS